MVSLDFLFFFFSPIISNLIYYHQDILERVYCMQIHFRVVVTGGHLGWETFPPLIIYIYIYIYINLISHIMAMMMPALYKHCVLQKLPIMIPVCTHRGLRQVLHRFLVGCFTHGEMLMNVTSCLSH